ncbi:hypothetical protein H6803_03250 [Candidatus Nomurabacteria bacterium]|nr:hypothetical protein [Candidatus Nomurabacteria bacterium]
MKSKYFVLMLFIPNIKGQPSGIHSLAAIDPMERLPLHGSIAFLSMFK